jgi:hypothetical protein
LAGALWALLAPPEENGLPRNAAAAVLLVLLAWTLLGWTVSTRVFPESFPSPLPPLEAFFLQGAGLFLGAVAFAVAGGRGRARLGAVFGLILSAIGWCASRWPVLARAIEMNGGVFAGPFLSGMLATALALTAAGVAALLLIDSLRPHALKFALLAALLWAVPTGAAEFALTRWWGLGPRTIAEAAGIASSDEAETVGILRLAPSRGREYSRETARMGAQNADLSPENLEKIEAFLRRVGYRDVFAAEAVADLRRGWLMWWEPERALDAMMLSVPGRVHPDYRGALDLIKIGPMTAERYDKLERLDADAAAGGGGFEQVTASQYIFEGFAAAYARFGDEANARRWLARVDNLTMVMEKKIEVAPLIDFRAGTAAGSLLIDDRPAGAVVVGLFEIWRTTPTAAGVRLLSASAFPDENGRFEFRDLGAGEYELGLLGRVEDLRGRVLGVPGRFVIDEEHPAVAFPPIRVERDVLPVPESFGPAGTREAPVPTVPEPALLFRKR